MTLNMILEKTRSDLERKKVDYPFEWLGRSLAFNNYPPRDIIPFLKATKEEPYCLICEVKNVDKDTISPNFDPLLLSQEYEKGGANAILVDTEPHFSKGDVEYLTGIRRYVSTPLLRKDFIIDKYQLLESVVYGADFILLIAGILTKKELKELLEYSRRLGLEALIEIRNKEELTKAIFAGGSIIGINHRGLEDSSLDLGLSEKLIPLIPNGKIIVANGGIDNKEIVSNLRSIGVDTCIVGESLIKSEDRVKALKELKGIE